MPSFRRPKIAATDFTSPAGPRPARRGRPQSRQGGWTAIELLIVIAILGLISILVIPNFLVSYQKGKQKRTMADMHKTGQAMVNWLTGQIGAMAAGANTLDLAALYSPIDYGDLQAELVPNYLPVLLTTDAWGTPYEFFVNVDNLVGRQALAIRSAGGDGIFEGSTYSYGPFVSTDFNRDIIWADGVFVRWPVGAQQ